MAPRTPFQLVVVTTILFVTSPAVAAPSASVASNGTQKEDVDPGVMVGPKGTGTVCARSRAGDLVDGTVVPANLGSCSGLIRWLRSGGSVLLRRLTVVRLRPGISLASKH